MSWKQILTKPIDNSALIVFRIFFGFLMFCEAVGAMALGWVQETFVEPEFTFNFIGFDFLQIFVGPQMYVIYVLMAIVSIMIMLGYRYRFAIISFTLLWSITYFAQKSHYNNHYYLVMLIGMLMCIVPANKYASLDVKQGRTDQSLSCPQWAVLIFVVQVAIVYFYASVAKMYPDWIEGKPIEIWYNYKSFETPFWGDAFAAKLKSFFTLRSVHLFFAYAGILFDLLVVPMFLWNRYSRTIALIASLAFHLLNSAIFQIGVFPYFALAFVVFFYDPDFIRRLFLKKKPELEKTESTTSQRQMKLLQPVLLIYFIIQIFLPIRHHLIPGKVLWTEEGHRLSWRMMLRTKQASTLFYVQEEDSNVRRRISITDYITKNQYGDVLTKPDMMWQLAQRIEQHYRKNDRGDVAIFVKARVGVNGRNYSLLTDENVDLTEVDWETFGHQDWLLEAPF